MNLGPHETPMSDGWQRGTGIDTWIALAGDIQLKTRPANPLITMSSPDGEDKDVDGGVRAEHCDSQRTSFTLFDGWNYSEESVAISIET